MTKCLFSLAVGLAVLAAFGFVQRGGDHPEVALTETTILPVETITIDPVFSFTKRRTFTGVLKASRTSELGFERTGRLLSIEVVEGDRVAQGQILAQLDQRNLQAKQQELTAERLAAHSLLTELEAGPRQQTIDVARAEVSDLQSQVELAELNFRRRERLLESRATSQEEYEVASLGLRSTRARLDAAQLRFDELEAGTRPERIEAQRAVVAQLDAALANIAVDIEESTLTAPFSGMIGKRYLDEGAIVSPASPLLRIVEVERLEAWIGVPASLATKLKSNDAKTVVIEGKAYAAKVKAVLPELDATTRTRTAVFQLQAADSVFPSQVARVELDDSAEIEGAWVPLTALTRGSRGLWSVLIAEQTGLAEHLRAARRDVEVLHTDGRRALVRGTLKAGDLVIVSGVHRVAAGQPITTSDRLGTREE